MSLLVDTNILVDVLRMRSVREERTAAAFRSLVPDHAPVCISVVTLCELFAGLKPREARGFRELRRLLTVIPVDEEIAERAGEYLQLYAASHGVELGDALVAATASTNAIPLWTLNAKHFPMRDVVLLVPGDS